MAQGTARRGKGMMTPGSDSVAPEGRLFPWLVLIVVVFALLSPGFLADTASGEAKKATGAKAGDCAVCHGTQRVLPPGHEATAAMDGAACTTCHTKKGKESLRAKMPLGHLHSLAGVSCQKCHGIAQPPEAVKMKGCTTCHGDPEKLAEKTKEVKPENPHTSPHYGTELDCNVCHHQHEKSENFCSQCHSFTYTVP
jgi:cytochrome c553